MSCGFSSRFRVCACKKKKKERDQMPRPLSHLSPPSPTPKPSLSRPPPSQQRTCCIASLPGTVERAESSDEWRLPDVARSSAAAPLAVMMMPPRSSRCSAGRLSTAAAGGRADASGPSKKLVSILSGGGIERREPRMRARERKKMELSLPLLKYR